MAKITWGSSGLVSGQMTYPEIYTNTKSVLLNGYLVEKLSILVVVQLSVGRYGNAETNQALTKKHIKSPCEILILACSFLTYWAGLYNEVTQEKILVGVQQFAGVCSQGAGDPPRDCAKIPTEKRGTRNGS